MRAYKAATSSSVWSADKRADIFLVAATLTWWINRVRALIPQARRFRLHPPPDATLMMQKVDSLRVIDI
jgi:hypothetical protein